MKKLRKSDITVGSSGEMKCKREEKNWRKYNIKLRN